MSERDSTPGMDNVGRPFAAPGERPGDEQLLAYLEGRLPLDEQHRVEQLLADEGLEHDALEGLKAMGPAEARAARKRVSKRLHKAISNRRGQLKITGRHNEMATWTAVLLLLLLAIVAFFVVRLAAGHI